MLLWRPLRTYLRQGPELLSARHERLRHRVIHHRNTNDNQQIKIFLQVALTMMVIAHRLSTMRDARTIIFTDRGRIVEQGNHESLMSAKGA
ncbi:MAG: hypothetical protein ACYC0I_01600 [Acidimicrobiales bacterium]